MSLRRRILWRLFWVLAFGFASIVEWAHFRRELSEGQPVNAGAAALAAVVTGFMASEALTGDWS